MNNGGSGVHSAMDVSTSGSISSNYNDIYSGGGSGGVFGIWSGTNETTLAAWRTASSNDANSLGLGTGVGVAPVFTSITDLHLTAIGNSGIAGMGIAGTGILTDYNGTTRLTGVAPSGPTIGINEVMPTYTITVNQGSNGTITPGTTSNIVSGSSQSFTATPAACYQLANWTVDGSSAGTANPYAFTNITANHTITATYSLITYAITSSTDPNGSITPLGVTNVNCGANQTYNMVPNSGYAVSDVQVDGVSQGAITSYTFTSVSATHTIAVTYVLVPNSITTTAATFGPFCNNSSNTISVAFTSTGTYTGNFWVQISDATGAFTATTTGATIISAAATTSPISATIPSGFTAGANYKIRVINDGPVTYGSDNGTAFAVTAPPATPTISYAGTPFCTSLATPQSVTLTGSGGTFPALSGLTLNSSTGAITPSTSTAGSYTVAYTIPASGGCAAVSGTTGVTITALPTATISYAGTPFCTSLSTGQAVTLTGSGGTFSGSGLTISGTTGAITPSTSTAGAHTVTYSIPAAGGCAVVNATTSVPITTLPTAPISYAGCDFGGLRGIFLCYTCRPDYKQHHGNNYSLN